MKVLVTGGAGYIGSHACKALAASGHEPVAFDNLSEGHRWAVKWGPLEQGDITDPARLAEVFNSHRPDAVMHFAARAYVGESVADPQRYYRNNVAGTLCLLDAMRRAGLSRIVFSSTCATYGVPLRSPLAEDHPQDPVNPYGRSKLTVEHILRDFAYAYGLKAIALRYFNAAGADPDGQIGEAHEPETHLIPLVLGAAANADQAITIFGQDYETADGTCIRDYTHVADLAAAHVLALEKLTPGAGFHAYNLGTGLGLSVREVIDVAQQVTGRSVRALVGPRRPGDPPILVADGSLAQRELGWRPAHSSPSEMVQSAWTWMMSRASK